MPQIQSSEAAPPLPHTLLAVDHRVSGLLPLYSRMMILLHGRQPHEAEIMSPRLEKLKVIDTAQLSVSHAHISCAASVDQALSF